ncbi:MAG: ABC transporter permease [Rhodoferax sp.]
MESGARGVHRDQGLIFSELFQLAQHKRLCWAMALSDVRSRYAGSALGFVWAFVQPALTIAAYYLVFDVVFALRAGADATAPKVGTYLIAGFLPWLAFCEGLSRGANGLLESAHLLRKNALPTVLPVARSVLTGGLIYLPLMILLTGVFVLWGSASWSALALLPLMVLLYAAVFLSAYAWAILIAAVRDAAQVQAFMLQIGVFLSPVLFPLSAFPENWRWLLYLNPASAPVQGVQAILLHDQYPPPVVWWVCLTWILVLAVVLELLLRRSADELVDWL